MSLRKYTIDICEDSGLLGSLPSTFPMVQNTKIGKFFDSAQTNDKQYRRIISRLLYLQATRPDIAYFLNILSQFVSDPCEEHMKAVSRILRCLKSTRGK